MNEEDLTGVRFHLNGGLDKAAVIAAIGEWQAGIGSRTRLFVHEVDSVLSGRVETMLVIEGFTVASRSPLGPLDRVIGISPLVAFLAQRFTFDQDFARVMEFPALLLPPIVATES